MLEDGITSKDTFSCNQSCAVPRRPAPDALGLSPSAPRRRCPHRFLSSGEDLLRPTRPKSCWRRAVYPQPLSIFVTENGALWTELTALQATHSRAPVGEDPRWASRGVFVEPLATAFPLVHETIELQKVNTYGLIYTWQGSDASLKPLLLMGHYGETIWGRGSWDDKSGFIGILTSTEVLLEHKFPPTSTAVLSFGFDEEAGGPQGAGHLSPVLLERFRTCGYSELENYGATFALVPMAEKGIVDVAVEMQTPGGHSSIPLEHTSIGILAAMIVHLEKNVPTPVLEVGAPAFEMAQCFGAHEPAMPPALKDAILRPETSATALKEAERSIRSAGVLRATRFRSSEVQRKHTYVHTHAVLNHRIATQSSVNATLRRDAELLLDVAGTIRAVFQAHKDVEDIAPGLLGGNTYASLALLVFLNRGD
ncbi:hypothetical protein B0H17DRAFT_1197927 [Mycena rosella]|uniref:Peptidase M20 dimerisation domain-containing protein n=1 Tax=Mycena rosella TaxID=1033263 RepID=A0AAD7DQR1_MYCRO|nr:hypothetical protein B0H17DRAFT_1197927 [Mycena rosella]